MKSESIKEIATALVKFNSEVSKISKDAENPFFKSNYASLDNIIDEVRPILTKYGLSILQFPGGDGTNVNMKTILLHESGEWIESEPFVMKPIKNDPQGVGSCITYARRYSISSFLSLNTGEDDDGNKATHPPKQTQGAPTPQQDPNIAAMERDSKLNAVLAKWQTLSGEKDNAIARASLAEYFDKKQYSIETISTGQLIEFEKAFAKLLNEKIQAEKKGA